jgi:hypothetical protein
MKKQVMLVAAILIALSASTALAFDPMGAPSADVAKGQWRLGAEYSYSDMDVERQPTSWGSTADRDIDSTIQKIWANIGYGLSENVSVFVRLGVANMEWDKIGGSSREWEGVDGDWGFAWGGGVKATLCESPGLKWGFVAQFSESDISGDEKDNSDEEGTYDIMLDEIQFAVGPTWDVAEGVRIYGGPFISLVRGHWSDTFDGDIHRKPIEDQGWLGAYIGTELNLNEATLANFEYMLTADGWGVTGGIAWRW